MLILGNAWSTTLPSTWFTSGFPQFAIRHFGISNMRVASQLHLFQDTFWPDELRDRKPVEIKLIWLQGDVFELLLDLFSETISSELLERRKLVAYVPYAMKSF